MHSWNIFGVMIRHEQTWIHKTHHGSNLGEATTFPLILYYVPLHEAHIQMAFFVLRLPNGSPEIPKVGTPTTLGPITLCANLRLRSGLKQNCSPHWELFQQYVAHHLHARDFQLLVVGSQIVNLIPILSFAHNLCFKCPNGSWEPILDI